MTGPWFVPPPAPRPPPGLRLAILERFIKEAVDLAFWHGVWQSAVVFGTLGITFGLAVGLLVGVILATRLAHPPPEE